MESIKILDNKGNRLTFCLETVRVFTSKGGLVIDSVRDTEEESLMDVYATVTLQYNKPCDQGMHFVRMVSPA